MKTTRENRIRKTNAGWCIDEKLTMQDKRDNPKLPFIKDEKGNLWSPIMSSKTKKELVDYLEKKHETGKSFRISDTEFEKVHTNPKAAAAHIAKIKARGGKVEKIVSKGKIKVISTYEEKNPVTDSGN